VDVVELYAVRHPNCSFTCLDLRAGVAQQDHGAIERPRSLLLLHLNLKLTGCCVPSSGFTTNSMQVSAQAFSAYTLYVY